MIVAAMAQDPITFVIARGICGIGVGGIIPIACALTSEYSDEKHKNFYFALMYCGYPAGHYWQHWSGCSIWVNMAGVH